MLRLTRIAYLSSLVLAASCSNRHLSPSDDAAGAAGAGAGGQGMAGAGGAGGVAGTGASAAGEGGAADAAAAGTGSVPDASAAGTGGPPDAAAETNGTTPVVPAKNYQLTGAWPARKVVFPTKPGKLTYAKIAVHDRYLADSCAIADYDNDGVPDVSSGRRWYEGPDFKVEHIFRNGHDDLPHAGVSNEINIMADDSSDFAWDMDGDGWADIINISPPYINLMTIPDARPQHTMTAVWYRNPGLAGADSPLWMPQQISDDVAGEHHAFADVEGDGWPEISAACKRCMETKGYYASAVMTNLERTWDFHDVTVPYTFPFGGTGLLHGFGLGDVNGDGRTDLIERGGAWLQQPDGSWNQTACPAAGCGWIKGTFYDGLAGDQRGGSQMFAADFDGDGDADIFSADWAHGWGLAWYEQKPGFAFARHQFLGSNTPQDAEKYGLSGFSEPHAAEVVDMDGDGVPDIVTGKQRFSFPNGYGVPDINGKAVVFVFKTVRTPSAAGGPVTFEPHLVDDVVGIGKQIGVGHLDADGILDFCTAGKLGLSVFLGQ